MAKIIEILNGQLGSVVRVILNNLIPGRTYYAGSTFLWTGDLSAHANRVISISYDHDLAGGNITLPPNCHLKFNGGQLLNVGTFTGNNTKISNPDNLQIFNTTVTFAGNWAETKATPQWFGAVCSPNPKTLPGAMVPGGTVSLNQRNEGGAVSSSPAIQKLFDSPFRPKFPNGYYYITTPIVINRSVYVNFGSPIREHIDEIPQFHYKNDHVRFYTDQDIKFWELRSNRVGAANNYVSSIYLIGGVMDVQLRNYYSESIYYASANYQLTAGEISGDAIGNLTAARVEGGTGTYFRWATDDVTPLWYDGYCTGLKIKTRSFYLNRGIIIDKPSGAGSLPRTWINTLNINAMFDGVKVAADIEDGGLGHIEVVAQSRRVNTVNELTLQCIKIGSPDSEVRAFVWDITDVPVDGYYTPQAEYAVLYTAPCKRLGNALTFANNRISKLINRPQVTSPINHDGDPVFLANRSTRDTFISILDSFFIGFHKLAGNTVTVNAYQGASINFDTELRTGAAIGLPTAANYSIANAANLLEQRGTPPTITIAEAANRDTDFLEIYIASTTVMYLTTLYASIVQDIRTIKRIQLIAIPSTGPSVLFDELCDVHANYRKDWWDWDIANQPYVGFIIRMIGSSQPVSGTASGTLRLNDIAAKGNVAPKPAYVPSLEAAHSKLKIVVSQTGTAAPTIAANPFLNSFYDSATVKVPITTSRAGAGDYRITGAFPVDRCFPTSQYFAFADGTGALLTHLDATNYRLRTYNAAGTLDDNVITGLNITIEMLW